MNDRELEPAMLPPVRRVTRLDLALVSVLAVLAIGIPIANLVRSFHTSERVRITTMKFGEATIGWSLMPIAEEQCPSAAEVSRGVTDWCTQPRTIQIDTSVSQYSGVNRRGYLDATTQFRDLQIDDGSSNVPIFTTVREPFTFQSLAEGTLLDLCGRIELRIDVNYIGSDNTCTHHDAEVSCGRLRLKTKEQRCTSRQAEALGLYRTPMPMPMASTFIPVSQKPL